jgi:hypothetical protein
VVVPSGITHGRTDRRVDRRTLVALAAPLVLLTVGGGAFALWKPNVVVSAAKSPQAAVLSVLAVAVALLATAVVAAISRRRWLGAVVGCAVVAGFLAVTVLPAFRVTTVREALPPTAGDSGTVDADRPAAPPATAAVVLGRGPLAGVDHRAAGTATLVRLAGGELVVRLEGLDVEPGPDYFVHLVPGTGATRPDGGTRLGRLKASRGDQNYPVPAAVRVPADVTVLIWCRAFAVPVAHATLR